MCLCFKLLIDTWKLWLKSGVDTMGLDLIVSVNRDNFMYPEQNFLIYTKGGHSPSSLALFIAALLFQGIFNLTREIVSLFNTDAWLELDNLLPESAWWVSTAHTTHELSSGSSVARWLWNILNTSCSYYEPFLFGACPDKLLLLSFSVFLLMLPTHFHSCVLSHGAGWCGLGNWASRLLPVKVASSFICFFPVVQAGALFRNFWKSGVG